jgi:hypothetical protein
MNFNVKILLTLVALAVAMTLYTSCQTRIVTRIAKTYPTLLPSETLVVLSQDDTTDLAGMETLAEFNIRDSRFSLQCNLETVLEKARQEARAIGANVLKITEHYRSRPWEGSCHRIKAKALRVADVTPYEREIVWHKDRRLKIADFKASNRHRPALATTTSSIRYEWGGSHLDGEVILTAQTVFLCQRSYFKRGADSLFVLEHEQAHFDIAEIYARKFIKLMQERVHHFGDLELKHEETYEEIKLACQEKQDHYDSEVYGNRRKQAKWLRWVRSELTRLEPYANKELRIREELL